jgi:hypothetical protein
MTKRKRPSESRDVGSAEFHVVANKKKVTWDSIIAAEEITEDNDTEEDEKFLEKVRCRTFCLKVEISAEADGRFVLLHGVNSV